MTNGGGGSHPQQQHQQQQTDLDKMSNAQAVQFLFNTYTNHGRDYLNQHVHLTKNKISQLENSDLGDYAIMVLRHLGVTLTGLRDMVTPSGSTSLAHFLGLGDPTTNDILVPGKGGGLRNINQRVNTAVEANKVQLFRPEASVSGFGFGVTSTNQTVTGASSLASATNNPTTPGRRAATAPAAAAAASAPSKSTFTVGTPGGSNSFLAIASASTKHGRKMGSVNRNLFGGEENVENNVPSVVGGGVDCTASLGLEELTLGTSSVTGGGMGGPFGHLAQELVAMLENSNVSQGSAVLDNVPIKDELRMVREFNDGLKMLPLSKDLFTDFTRFCKQAGRVKDEGSSEYKTDVAEGRNAFMDIKAIIFEQDTIHNNTIAKSQNVMDQVKLQRNSVDDISATARKEAEARRDEEIAEAYRIYDARKRAAENQCQLYVQQVEAKAEDVKKKQTAAIEGAKAAADRAEQARDANLLKVKAMANMIDLSHHMLSFFTDAQVDQTAKRNGESLLGQLKEMKGVIDKNNREGMLKITQWTLEEALNVNNDNDHDNDL